mgnify:FL=1
MCEITKATLGRLPTYLEFLYNVKDERETISTSTIANALSFGAVQVKKDLSSVCDKGKPKVGYKTAELIQDIEKVINGVKTGIVLIGVGKLGRAILDYNGFEKFGMKISAAFDNDESKTGQSENGIKILSSAQLKDYCKDNNINIGIIAVPKTYAQEICDTLVDGGVKAIWNFAPVKLKTKDGINVLQEDLSLSLAYLNLKSR